MSGKGTDLVFLDTCWWFCLLLWRISSHALLRRFPADQAYTYIHTVWHCESLRSWILRFLKESSHAHFHLHLYRQRHTSSLSLTFSSFKTSIHLFPFLLAFCSVLSNYASTQPLHYVCVALQSKEGFSWVGQQDHAGILDLWGICTSKDVLRLRQRKDRSLHCHQDDWCWLHVLTKAQLLSIDRISQPNKEDFDCTCQDHWGHTYKFVEVSRWSLPFLNRNIFTFLSEIEENGLSILLFQVRICALFKQHIDNLQWNFFILYLGCMKERVVHVNVKLIDYLFSVRIGQYQSNGFNVPKDGIECTLAQLLAQVPPFLTIIWIKWYGSVIYNCGKIKLHP